MKTVLVPVGGSDADHSVFEMALAVARLLAAHLDFLHVRVSPSSAALNTPHMDYVIGARRALNDLQVQTERRRFAAEGNVKAFCSEHGIAMVDKPGVFNMVTARWREEEGDAIQRLLLHGRHSDLIVMARPTQSDALPANRLEILLLQCGRPLLIVPTRPAQAALATAMVCWKETSDAARAVSAAMPLLTRVKRVIIVSIREDAAPEPGAVEDLVGQMAWHGLNCESQILPRDGKSTADVLFSVAENFAVDVMVMGGYGHSHAREVLFGGCTQAAIETANIPILLMH
jgi:nucleotide-binding universal stress UspA family protein